MKYSKLLQDHHYGMQMRGSWRDQQHNQDHMHHAHMTAPNHREGHEPNIHKHIDQMQKHLAEHIMHKHPHDQMDKPAVDQMDKHSAAEKLHKHAMEQSHPSKARSEDDSEPNRFANQLLGMQQARQAYQPQQQYRPSPCGRVVASFIPHSIAIPISHPFK